MATEVGQAYIQIIPSAKGISGSISSLIDKEAGSAGRSGGSLLSKGLTGGISAFTVAAGTMLANMATSAAHALGSIARNALEVGASFETSLAKVQSISGGTAAEMAAFSKEVLAMSNATAQSADNINEAVYSVISATGKGMSESLGIVKQANQLATAGFADLDSSIAVMTTAMNAYHMSAEDAAHISDSLITTQNLGVTTVAELSAAMGKAIATGGAYGISLENIESGYISLTKNGINTAEATTYMSSMFKELADNGTAVGQIITQKTGKSFGTLMAKGYSVADVLAIVSDSVKGDSEALMNLWSSAEAGKASAAIMSQGLDTFNENLETLRTSTGTTAAAYETMTNTFQFKSNQLKNSISNLGIMIYQGVGGPLAELTGIANEGVQNIAAAFQEGGFSAIGPAVMDMMSNVGNYIIQKLPDITTAVNTLLQGVGTFIANNQTAITTAVTSVVSGIASSLPIVIPTLITVGMSILTGLIQGVFSALPVILPDLINAAVQILTMLVTGLVENIDLLINGFIMLCDGIGQALSTVDWSAVGSQVMTSIGTALQNASPGAIAVIAGIGALMVGKFAMSIAPIASKVGGALSGVIGKFTSLGSAASTAAAPVSSAGSAMGTLSSNALGLVAAGAGILLAATGLALLAQAAIGIAEAGPGAAIALGALVIAIAGFALGAAAVAPALTAGAAGLIAFGAAIALVGAGVLMACGGMAILATQLPTIAEYGLSASVAIAALGVAMGVFAPGAIAGGAAAVVAGTGLLTMAAGLLAAGAGALVAAAGVAVLSAALTLLSGALALLGGGFTICATGLQRIGSVATTASIGFTTLAAALGVAFVPMVAGAASCAALALAIGALDLSLIGLTVTLGTSAVAAAALGVSMELVAGAVTTICDSAMAAAQAMQDMVNGVDVVKNGLNGLKDIAAGAVEAFVNSFQKASPTAVATATTMAQGINTAIQTSMLQLPILAKTAMTSFVLAITSNVGAARNAGLQVANGVASGMSGMPSKVATIARTSAIAIRAAFEAINWEGVGINIDKGIANGMLSGEGLDSIRNAAKEVAQTALKEAKAALKVGSPSKLMRDEVGRWIPEGIAEGITENMDSVEDAMSDISTFAVLKDRLKLNAFEPGQLQPAYATAGTNVTQNNTFYTHDSLSERELCQQTENMAARLRWKLG